ncbi:hypothetical protein METSCH_F04940 [Metschnikowia aff. pulcherrima]|uniref:Uncharacterized protein n=1 Tax=Metschnikowia aff. pulcherrima TaxID=2163413 RepID=A0A4P6XWC5_9ASCO|nr:hypothetical protein METSCH_F04940 [Metschnikowia aff. pulcherrima]
MKAYSFLIPVLYISNVAAMGCDWNQAQNLELKTTNQPNTDASENSLPKPINYVYKRGIGNSNDKNKNEQANLDNVLIKMRNVFQDPKFDPIKSHSVIDALRDQLSTIGFLEKGIKSHDVDGFSKLYSTVQEILTAMLDAAGSLQKYSGSEDPVHVLLYKVTKLYLSALALFDARGTLDLRVDGFDEHMLQLRRCLFKYVKDFINLSHVSSEEVLMFQTQALLVDTTLRKLEVGLPRLSIKPV